MTTVTDAELFSDADRVKDKVVLITGAANGLGKAAALLFGKHGAKVVIGDLDMKGAAAVVAEIKSLGSDAVAQQCDVTSWEQQLSLFTFAMTTFNRVDIVIPNAGVTELGQMSASQKEAVNGIPTRPNMKTLEVNLVAVVYTARLALFYLLEKSPGGLKSLVFLGSMASLECIPGAPLYSSAKHGLIGLMSSLHSEHKDRIRFGVVCPWFADTAIVPTPLKIFMAGIPMTPVSRIGGAIFKAATDRDPETNGALLTLPDDGMVFRINRSQVHLDQGIYKILNDRVASTLPLLSKLESYGAVIKGLIRILKGKLVLLGVVSIVGALAWLIGSMRHDN